MTDNISKYARYIAAIITALSVFAGHISAQEIFENVVSFDKTVHDFGQIKYKSGPVKCTFVFRNVSDKPVVVYAVNTSCGCTDLEWTKEPVLPQKTGKISVVYSNDEGPYPFDKSITVRISSTTRPIILRVRGVCTEKEQDLSEIYTEKYGPLGLRKTEFSLGNIDQGKTRKDEEYIANLSDSPLSISFTDVSEGLSISVSPNPIPAKGLGKLLYSVRTKEGMWGKNNLTAVPVIKGKAYADRPVSVRCFVKEDFSRLTDDEKRSAPVPTLASSTYNFGRVSSGTVVKGSFILKNQGRRDLKIHKIEADSRNISFDGIGDILPGESAKFGFSLNTSQFAPGEEVLVIVTLTTNAPGRPMINLFVQGYTK